MYKEKKKNDPGKSTGNTCISVELIVISEISCFGGVKQHPWLLNGIHMPNSELANHLQGWVTYLITGEHTDIKSKLTQKSFFSPDLLQRNGDLVSLCPLGWCLRITVISASRILSPFLDWFFMAVSPHSLILVMLQCGACPASHWQRGPRALTSLSINTAISGTAGKLCYLFMLEEVS